MQYPQHFWKDPINWLAFGLGSGRAKQMPGTWGTLAAMPFAYGLLYLPNSIQLLIIVIAFILGCWICQHASKQLGVHDHGGIVWDEFVGVWITLWMSPPQLGVMIMGFVLFRILDIVKPWPICWLDKKVQGGFGIMLDDVLAGVMACGVLQLLLYYRVF